MFFIYFFQSKDNLLRLCVNNIEKNEKGFPSDLSVLIYLKQTMYKHYGFYLKCENLPLSETISSKKQNYLYKQNLFCLTLVLLLNFREHSIQKSSLHILSKYKK